VDVRIVADPALRAHGAEATPPVEQAAD